MTVYLCSKAGRVVSNLSRFVRTALWRTTPPIRNAQNTQVSIQTHNCMFI